jgi:hypothetical protein
MRDGDNPRGWAFHFASVLLTFDVNFIENFDEINEIKNVRGSR